MTITDKKEERIKNILDLKNLRDLSKNLDRSFNFVFNKKFEAEIFLEEDISKRFAYALLLGITAELSRIRSYGCVSFFTNGSHEMDYLDFLKSADVICKRLKDLNLKKIEEFIELKKIGMELENEMFKVTGGLNTYKGLIFISLILMWAMSRENNLEAAQKSIIEFTKSMPGISGTFGESLREKNIHTIVDSAKEGFKILNPSLKILDEKKDADELSIFLFKNITDTTTIKRMGLCEYLNLKNIKLNTQKNRAELERVLLQKKSTTGGVADLFAITICLYAMGC